MSAGVPSRLQRCRLLRASHELGFAFFIIFLFRLIFLDPEGARLSGRGRGRNGFRRAHHPRRVPCHRAARHHIARDHTARTHHRACADGDARQHDCPRRHPRTVADGDRRTRQRKTLAPVIVRRRAKERLLRNHRADTERDRGDIVNLRPVADRRPGTDGRAGLRVQGLVPTPRLERGTPRSTIWCSNQLS